MFQFPDAISTEVFLSRYWQKAPLFVPQALPAGLPELSADELGWLATLDDVESRLIFSERIGDTVNYRVEHGPFDEKVLAALPPEDWTLLVQDVEKHLPDFRRLIRQASFIPDWRVDDLMASFAAPGGSVGPHRDNYDVFLCQGMGQREWRIAPACADLKIIESAELLLLEPFADESPVTANSGDVLYLPPGIAHWGIASESCMTYSIGMRAPTLSEFMAGLARIHETEVDHERIEDYFYSDPDLTESEAEPGLISERALARARASFTVDANLSDEEFALVFGSVVTDVKAWLAPEAPSRSEIVTFLKSPFGRSEVQMHGMARLAFCAGKNRNLIFANGVARTVSRPQLDVVRRICMNRAVQAADSELFIWLADKGAFDLLASKRKDAT